MNILFYLHKYPNIGGIEKVTEIIANYLTEKGYNISILSYINNPKVVNKDANISHYIMPEKTIINSKENVQYISYLFTKKRFDIVIFQDSYAPIEKPLFNILNSYKTKLIIVEHNTPNCGWKIFWYNLLRVNLSIKKLLFLPYRYWYMSHHTQKRHKLLYNKADKYILLSQKFIPILSNIIKVKNPSKCLFINNPITIQDDVDPTIKRKKQLLFVGRFTHQKGISLLLKIWRSLYKQYPDWNLTLVGEGELENFIKSYITKYNLKNIQIEGYQANPSSYYNESKILCMTSIFEGWGLVLTEAMSLGCIPIAFNSFESVYDIIDNEKNGFIIPHFKVKSYIKTLQLLMEDEALCNKISNNAVTKSKKYLIENIGKQWEGLIHEIQQI